MSHDVKYENTEQALQDAHDDGRAFQHQQELHRDASLNGATIAVFDIERQALDRSTHRAARRMVWDDGTGMSDDTFRNVFAKISMSATAMTSPYLGPDPDPRWHSRKGHGGRATTVTFNGYGFVCLTVQDGQGRMMWWFRKLNGKPALRDLPLFESGTMLDGMTDFIVPPYIEPEWIDYDNDPEFAEVLISLGMEEGEDSDGSRVVRNPEFGLDWRQLPLQYAVVASPAGKGRQIADSFSVLSDGTIDRVLYEKDGQDAHGTTKVMLGETPNDDTAVTGDPYFREERSPDSYASWLHQHLWDMPITTFVWNLFPRTTGDKHTTWDLEILDPQGNAVTQMFSAQVRHPLGVREHFFGPGGSYIEWQSQPIQVDASGTTVTVTVLKDDTPGLHTGWAASGRQGFIANIYNNELYERESSPAWYRNHGIGRDLKDRIFFVYTPPIADGREATYSEGVYNDSSRSEIQWFPGSGDVRRMMSDWAENYMFAEPDEIKAMKSANAPQASVDDVEFRKRFSELFQDVTSALRSAAQGVAGPTKRSRKTKPEWMRSKETEQEQAHIEGRDDIPMTDEDVQGLPGDNVRPPLNCELCNPNDDPDIFFHEDGCPNKRPSSGGGGTKGKHVKGRADPDGPLRGGPSKAKVRPKIERKDKKKPLPDTQVDFDPPVLEPGVFGDDEKWYIFDWRAADGDPTASSKAGRVGVNIDLATTKSWLGQVDAGANPPRPVGIGNLYLVAEIERYVTDSPGYDPDQVVDAVYGAYTDTACQAVVVAIAHKVNKMPWPKIKDEFLTAEALTASVLAQADMKQRIRSRIAGLPRRATP